MRKRRFASTLLIFAALAAQSLVSCAKKEGELPQITVDEPELEEISPSKKLHSWYCFTEDGFMSIDLPQNAPAVLEKPWTESVRIASAASVPSRRNGTGYDAYAIVNRMGVLAFSRGKPSLFADTSIFSSETADSLVFCGTSPVFFLYKSTFFNDKAPDQNSSLLSSRPFLVEFNPGSSVSYPVVCYSNLNLQESDQISGFFWDGTKWACSVKSPLENGVSFSYFSWESVIDLTDLSPALSQDAFIFHSCTEAEYRALNTPRLFENAPKLLCDLLSSLPKEFPFYVSWRDESGTSPVSYFNEGNGASPLNAKAAIAPGRGLLTAVFEDGTTYVKTVDGSKSIAFRLPRLPASFKYGDFAVSGDVLVVAWEESNFYKTARSGFITVDLSSLME